jgi:hypothetical protein
LACEICEGRRWIALIVSIARGREPDALLVVGGLCGLVVHAALILTALTAVSIPRYVLGLWVPLAIGIGFSGLWIAQLGARVADGWFRHGRIAH